MEYDIFDDIIEAPEELTLWQELWAYFKGKYFPRSVGSYQNLGIDPDDPFPIWCIIAALALGLIFASLLMILYKKIYGAFVEKMLSQGALGRENAKTLAELGYERNLFVRIALKSRRFHSVIRSADEELFYEKQAAERVEYEEKRKVDKNAPKFKEADYKIGDGDRFYIPEERKYTAEIRFDTKGASWRPFVLVCIVAIVGYFVIMAFLPQILTFLDSIIGTVF